MAEERRELPPNADGVHPLSIWEVIKIYGYFYSKF
jgi:hypothetical protein